MNRLAAPRRASAASPRCRPASMASATRPPRWLATAGRGRSAGSSICSGSPASAPPSSTTAAAPSRLRHRPRRRAPPAATACSRHTAHRQRCASSAATPAQRARYKAARSRASGAATSRRRRCDDAAAAASLLLGAELEQMRPQRQLARQIEAPSGRRRQRRRKLGFLGRRNRKPQPRRRGLKDRLPRHPGCSGKHRAQALVPLDQVAQRALQRRTIEPPHKPQPTAGSRRDCPGCACAAAASGVPPPASSRLQEPQPALRIGQRDLGRTRPRQKRRTRRARLRPKPQRQRRHARRLEQAADRKPRHRAPNGSADQRRRQSECPPSSKNLSSSRPRKPQHLGKHPHSSASCGFARRPLRSTGRHKLRLRQRTPVGLPFGVSGSRSQHHNRDGTIVLRQHLPQQSPKRIGPGAAAPPCQPHSRSAAGRRCVGARHHQPPAPRPFAQQHTSISPGSIRNPRSFTCASARPKTPAPRRTASAPGPRSGTSARPAPRHSSRHAGRRQTAPPSARHAQIAAASPRRRGTTPHNPRGTGSSPASST